MGTGEQHPHAEDSNLFIEMPPPQKFHSNSAIDLVEEGFREREKKRTEKKTLLMEKEGLEGVGGTRDSPPPSRDVMCTRTSTADPPVEWKWMNPYFPFRLRVVLSFLLWKEMYGRMSFPKGL
ncbi:hypothetical protein CDAR_457981 [Caerostris darwini]|uniref:Uncharacterized protein n=1 Tax=Caerostris darwini TaxID=1538125 RepID=A0AAV4TNZ0_9ARAC|nr:hypothetical protein CDAR_457981 [Caerostris darwini]